jgi:hypothetical protein
VAVALASCIVVAVVCIAVAAEEAMHTEQLTLVGHATALLCCASLQGEGSDVGEESSLTTSAASSAAAASAASHARLKSRVMTGVKVMLIVFLARCLVAAWWLTCA